MIQDTWAIIQDRITQLSDLNKRMDDTAALLYWDDKPYELVKPDGKTKIKDAISVTPNLPKVFAHGVISDLMGGKWQTVVEGGISPRDAHMLEEFTDANFEQADERLLEEHGIPSLFSWLCNHVCLRWAIGARWIAQVIDEKYQVDCLPVDMRWTPFVPGKWVAQITFRDGDDLERELEEYERLAKDTKRGEYTRPSFSSTDGSSNEVRDYWSNKENELWVNSSLVYKQPNRFGYPPFVIVIPSSGFMLQDKEHLKHRGEDLLFLSSGLYKEYARSLSLVQTALYGGLYPGFLQKVEIKDSSPAEPPPQHDETVKVNLQEGYEVIRKEDISRAGQIAIANTQEGIAAGAPLSPRSYNTPPSAVLLLGETELIARLQNVRKEALGVFRSKLARMVIDQFIALEGKEVLIGGRGKKKNKYSAFKLGDPDNYNITYRLLVKNKRQEMANLAEFIAVGDQLPMRWKLENVLMADDSDGIIRDLELEKAKALNPSLGLIEMGLRFLEEAERLEDEVEADAKREQAKILAHEYVMAMRARIQPQVEPSAQPREVEEPRGNSQLLASMGAGAMRGEVVRPPQPREPGEVR